VPRYRYGRQYNPPAPLLPLRVGRPGAAPAVLLPALVDTGADLSVLPQGLPARLRLPAVGRLAVAGVEGVPRPLPVYAVEVSVNGYRSIVRAVSLGPIMLVGRDLINKITIRLHGPDAALEVDFPPATSAT
jgi:predicted aspartyl protease